MVEMIFKNEYLRKLEKKWKGTLAKISVNMTWKTEIDNIT